PFGAQVAAVSTLRNTSSGTGSVRSRRTARSVLIASNRSMPAFSVRRSYGGPVDSTSSRERAKRGHSDFSIGKSECPLFCRRRPMNSWKIGDVKISRIVESEAPWDGTFVLPDATADNVRSVGWLQPHFATADGKMNMSIHALVVESQGMKVVVD